MRALQRTLAEQDAVVGDDADRIAPDMGETANQGLAVELLEFVELRAVDHARDDVTHIIRLAAVGGDDAVDFLGRKQRLAAPRPGSNCARGGAVWGGGAPG